MLRNISYLALALSLASCGGSSGGSSSGGDDDDGGSVNSLPVITLASTQSAIHNAAVNIDASVTDADGDALTYTWSTTSNTITLGSLDTEDTSFTAPNLDETITLTLTVSDGVGVDVSDSILVTVNDGTTVGLTTAEKLATWTINTNGTLSNVTEVDGITGATYQVQSVSESGDSMVIQTDGIPKFEVIFTQDMKDELEARPRHLTNDFSAAGITVSVGDTVFFGDDIGFNTSAGQDNCTDHGGVGYWPPGPDCAGPQDASVSIPLEPVLAASKTECTQGLGTLGLYVNGTSIFGWGDGMSTGSFQNLAAEQEKYDLDICSGHAAMGEYHNHNYSQCLADLVGDVGDAHSPVYGFSSDGFPIHGPWDVNGDLAVSGWKTRDYSASAAGGCPDGARSCILNDEYNIDGGVTDVAAGDEGPAFDATDFRTASQNPLVPVNGVFYEDYYYFAGDAVTGTQLDQNNGHTDDERGYHYHITLEFSDAGALKPSFPYTYGPNFSGEMAEGDCGGAGGAGGPGGPGGPGG